MIERLKALTTDELDRSAEKLVRLEKRNVALLIAHIAEMSRRMAALVGTRVFLSTASRD
jgi:hypothetical protein